MGTPYDEGQVRLFVDDSIQAYTRVGRNVDAEYAIWTARMQFDSWDLQYPPAREKQLRLLNEALQGRRAATAGPTAALYNEDQVRIFVQDSIQAYMDANRGIDPEYAIWTARMQFDSRELGYPGARSKQLKALQGALGLTPPAPIPVPPGEVVLKNLRVRGQFFETEDALFTAIQCSDFDLAGQYQHGQDIRGILAQRQRCGFNMLRVWTAFDIPGIGTYTDIDYGILPPFVALCASYGLYVEFCGYTGINDPTHWTQLCEAARQCSPRPLLELVNELDQNTNEPDHLGRIFNLSDYGKPNDVLTSHGSNGSERWPVEPYWDYCTMHFNDAFEWQRKVGHNAWEIWRGPTLSNENTRYLDKADSVILAGDAAAGAALLCAGSCYHSQAGKTSDLWAGREEDAATAWAQGARQVNLGYQDGRYYHAIDLEGPGILRAYQRIYDDGRGDETVLIHKEPAGRMEERARMALSSLSPDARDFFLAWFRDYVRYSHTRSQHDDETPE